MDDLQDGVEYLLFTERGTRTGRFSGWNYGFTLTDCTHPLQNAYMPVSAVKMVVRLTAA